MGCHFLLQCMKVKSESEVTQSCPTLSDPISDPMDCSLPGASVHGIFQARDWCGVPLPSPNGSAGYINPNFPVHPKPLPHPHVHMSVPYVLKAEILNWLCGQIFGHLNMDQKKLTSLFSLLSI